ncbi:MAG: hypothetical protein ACSW76_04605 [Bacteroidaceae bacterium]
MNTNFKMILAASMAVALVCCGSKGSKIDPQRVANRNVEYDQYFTEIKADAAPAKPDEKGFIRRWTIIEPINKPNSGNTVFTDSYILAELTKEYFKGQFTSDIKSLPKTGDQVIVESEAPRAGGRGGFGGFGGGAPQGAGAPGAGQARPQGAPGAGAPGAGQARPQGAPQGQGQARPQGAPQGMGGFGGFGGGMMGGGAPAAAAAPQMVKDTLTWHSVDSKLYNIKLIRFALGTSEGQKRYGLIFNAFTVINCEKDMVVRLAAGSNSASIWWVNGEKVLTLQADRRMVADDGMSKRITLKKGKNLVRAAVINGPGMSDMCMRFYNEDGSIVKNITITNN